MTDTSAIQLIERIRTDMHQAMKDENTVKRDALRSLLARISNTEAVGVESSAHQDSPIAGAVEGVGNSEVLRRQLTLHDVRVVIRAELEEIEAPLKDVGHTSEYGAQLRQKAKVVEGYL